MTEITGALLPPTEVTLVLPHDLDPQSYISDKCPGARGGFRRNSGFLVTKAQPLPAGTSFRLKVHGFTSHDGTPDDRIEQALGGTHLFDATQVCGIFAALQSLWEEGDRRFVGANALFITEGVAGLFFRVDSLDVDTRPRIHGNYRHECGDRVLAPAA